MVVAVVEDEFVFPGNFCGSRSIEEKLGAGEYGIGLVQDEVDGTVYRHIAFPKGTGCICNDFPVVAAAIVGGEAGEGV